MKLLLAASMMAAGMLAAMPPATAHGVNHRHRIVHTARHVPDAYGAYMCRAYPAYGYVGSDGAGAYAGYRGYPMFGIYPSYGCAGDYNAF
jgi:hypothetical protein